MKTLLLMRHAKPSHDEAVADHDRPLDPRGEKMAHHMAQVLVGAGVTPGLILSSTALRARTTAFAVAEAFDWQPELRLRRELYMAEADGILKEGTAVPAKVGCLLMIGHNPGIQELVRELSTKRQSMPTAAIARFALPIVTWRDVRNARGMLIELWRPNE